MNNKYSVEEDRAYDEGRTMFAGKTKLYWRNREDEKLDAMSETEINDIEKKLCSQRLLDCLYNYPRTVEKRMIEKLLCGDVFIVRVGSFLNAHGYPLDSRDWDKLRSEVLRMTVGEILASEDQAVQIVANYLVTNSQ